MKKKVNWEKEYDSLHQRTMDTLTDVVTLLDEGKTHLAANSLGYLKACIVIDKFELNNSEI